MSYTFCSSFAILTNAGKNVSSTAAASDAIISQFYDEAEGDVCTATRHDWVANSAAISTNFLPCLADAIGCLAAVKVINYDPSGYTSRGESENIINVLYDRALQCIKWLQRLKSPTKGDM